MEKVAKEGKGGKRGKDAAQDVAPNSTAKNDQKTESTLARFVGRFEMLTGESGSTVAKAAF